jgi:hypothetical protein
VITNLTQINDFYDLLNLTIIIYILLLYVFFFLFQIDHLSFVSFF